MAQVWSDVYYRKILAYLGLPNEPRFVDLITKIQGYLEDEDYANAEKWAKALADLVKSEAGAGHETWGTDAVNQTQIVNDVFDAIRLGISILEEDGDPEFEDDLLGDWVLPDGNVDPVADPNAGGVDVGQAERDEAARAEAEDAATEERAENLVHMAARNLDLIGDTRYDGDIIALINIALMGDPGLIRVAEELAQAIAADRGMAPGPELDAFVRDMRTRLADQAMRAAEAWNDPDSPEFPNLGNDTRVLTVGGDDESDGGGTQPGFHPGGGDSDSDSDSDGSDRGNGRDGDRNTLDRSDLFSRDEEPMSIRDEDPERPPSSHYEPPNFRQQMDAQTEPELQDAEAAERARAAAEAAREAAEEEALDIAKIAEFLNDNDKEGAKALALRAANEMRRAGRSDESAGAIAKRLLAAAIAQARAGREATEAANALPDAVWDDPRMLRVGMQFVQAYTEGDVKLARQILAKAVALARQIAEQLGLLAQIGAEEVLNNFLPHRADRDIEGPEAELRAGLDQVDAAVKAHEEKKAAKARAATEPPTVAPPDLPPRDEGEGPRDGARDGADDVSASDPDPSDLRAHIQAQMAEMLRALQANDPQTARALALRLEARLAGVAGPFGDMKAADILRLVIKKKRAIDKENGVPDPIVASADKSNDDDSESTVSSVYSVDVKNDDNRDNDDDEPPAAGAALSLKLVAKVDWEKFVEVYSLSPEEIEALKEIATKIVRKGPDATAVIKGGKELLARAKKAKSGAKFKNGIHVAAAVEDVLLRRAENKKLTKPMKASDIPDDADVAA
ncbi:MAG: hypothetical protein AAF865_17480 [Pseudomonadota bacterium]